MIELPATVALLTLTDIGELLRSLDLPVVASTAPMQQTTATAAAASLPDRSKARPGNLQESTSKHPSSRGKWRQVGLLSLLLAALAGLAYTQIRKPPAPESSNTPPTADTARSQPIAAPPQTPATTAQTANLTASTAPATTTDHRKPATSTSPAARSATATVAVPPATGIVVPTLRLQLYELRPPRGSNCAAVRFGKARVRAVEIKANSRHLYRSGQMENLCGVAVTAQLQPPKPSVSLTLQAHFLRGDPYFSRSKLFQKPATKPGPTAKWRFLFQRRLRSAFEHTPTVQARKPGSPQPLRQHTRRHQASWWGHALVANQPAGEFRAHSGSNNC